MLQELLTAHPLSDHTTIILHDVAYEDMQALLDFVYTGGVTVPEHRLASFLEAAHALQIRVLTDKSLHQQLPARLPVDKTMPPLIKVDQHVPFFYPNQFCSHRNGFKAEYKMPAGHVDRLATDLSELKSCFEIQVKPEHRQNVKETEIHSEQNPKHLQFPGGPVAEYKSYHHSPQHLSPVSRPESNHSGVTKYDTTSSSGSSPVPDTLEFQWVRPLPSLMPILTTTVLNSRGKLSRKPLGGILIPSPWAQNGRPPLGAPRVIRSPDTGGKKSVSVEETSDRKVDSPLYTHVVSHYYIR